jgi:hypothetical protein
MDVHRHCNSVAVIGHVLERAGRQDTVPVLGLLRKPLVANSVSSVPMIHICRPISALNAAETG